MNIQTRYQNYVGDMITLLQQGMFRFITQQQVDLIKFFQYFKQFYKNLTSLQEKISDNRRKFTKNLMKINELSQKIDFNYINSHQNTINLQPNSNFKRNTTNEFYKKQKLSKTTFSTKNINNEKPQKTQQLNVIGQIQENQDFSDIKFTVDDRSNQKRIGTAQGIRQKMNITIDIHNPRPFTGKTGRNQFIRSRNNKSLISNHKQRYRSLTKYDNFALQDQFSQKKFDQINTFAGQKVQKNKAFNIGRNTIYDFLEEQSKKSKKNQFSEEFYIHEMMKSSEKKKKKNFSRWSFKINKLL